MPQPVDEHERRRGRRTGNSGTRGAILKAAQARFASEGYAATSIRKVASDAGVDPALVMQFYQSKDALFAASLALSDQTKDRIAAVFDCPRDGFGEILTRDFLSLWEEGDDAEALMATLRGAASNEYAAERLREFIQTRLVSIIGPKVGSGSESAERAGIAISMLMGLVLARDIVAVPLVAGRSREEIAALVGPLIQSLLGEADGSSS